jgi:hypothetical protein
MSAVGAAGANPVQHANDNPPQEASGLRKYAKYITWVVLFILALAALVTLCISMATLGTFAAVFITPLALGALYETLIAMAATMMIVAAFASGYFSRNTVDRIRHSILC